MQAIIIAVCAAVGLMVSVGCAFMPAYSKAAGLMIDGKISHEQFDRVILKYKVLYSALGWPVYTGVVGSLVLAFLYIADLFDQVGLLIGG